MGSTSTKAKKNETKTAFKQWNTDGDKFLTFKEFDAGMQSLGITQESFLFGSVVILGGPYHMGNMYFLHVHVAYYIQYIIYCIYYA